MGKSFQYNQRATAIWESVSIGLLPGARIADLGCGYGDLSYLSLEYGKAKRVISVDKNLELVEMTSRKCAKFTYEFVGFCMDIADEGVIEYLGTMANTAFCFSVLPYLPWRTTLARMAETFERSFIECQYAGDGPGLAGIKDDDDFQKELRLAGFPDSIKTGYTLVEGRNKYRSIWLCYGKGALG